jgi:hypothetical protein
MRPAVGGLRFDPEREAEFRIPSERPLALTSDLAEDPHLSAIIATLDPFLWPALQAAARREPSPHIWPNGGPWKES